MKSLENDILANVPLDSLPQEWQWRTDSLKRFSENKGLFDFQKDALENALKTLWLFYGAQDNSLLNRYRNNEIRNINESEVNRMGFWMATGSGKTLVIIKVIEMLAMLMKRRCIEDRDIMFLVYRDNLLDQFKCHVDEYNIHNPDTRINLIELKNYEQTKRDNPIPFSTNEVKVFFYRADLFLEKNSTAKKINTSSCDNNGNWFVLLDEAHRGDRNESKLKNIYNNFARNGFLFNFSATFTEDIDLQTCAFNFNLEKFIQDGYGKQIHVSGENIDGFRETNDFSHIEKQRTVLKTLILQTYISQQHKKIKQSYGEFYHKPLLLTITNTVQQSSKSQGPDLKLFFTEIKKIAENDIEAGLFDNAKNELKKDMKDAVYFFGKDPLKIDIASLSKIKYTNVLEKVFNTRKPGKVEAITVRQNNQEIAFKVTTSNTPFALIRIGDISKWMNEILVGYEKVEHYADDAFFASLNSSNSGINILMGSRTFYEGWDSNRPNIILFINIGLGRESRKFVLQSVGRGVRIEPEKGKRKRLLPLFNADEIDDNTYTRLKGLSATLESLFVFGTDSENLQQIIKSFEDDSDGNVFHLGEEFIVNPEVKGKLLLVPVYRSADDFIEQGKYAISKQDLDLTRNFVRRLDDKILLAKYGRDLDVLQRTREKIDGMKEHEETRSIKNPELTLDRLFDFFSLRKKQFDKFNKLGDMEIVHFKKIQFRGKWEDYKTLKDRLSIVRDLPKNEKQVDLLLDENKREQAKILQKQIIKSEEFSTNGERINIKHLANHYYHPLLVSLNDKVEYLKHIIDVRSEVDFLKMLEEQQDSFSEFDWWMFSKLDDTLDKIYIPYYSTHSDRYDKFYPDFIFWFEQGEDYHILFIDPKGGAHTSYQYKADGYDKLFCVNGKEKIIEEHGRKIRVHLRFFSTDTAPENYRNYWIDQVSDIPKFITSK